MSFSDNSQLMVYFFRIVRSLFIALEVDPFRVVAQSGHLAQLRKSLAGLQGRASGGKATYKANET